MSLGGWPGDSNGGASTPGGAAPVNENIFGVGIELMDGSLDVYAMTPGCSAERSGSIAIGDEVISVDDHEALSVDRARKLMRGRLGTYATLGLRRYEGDNMRTFKVQLVRGPVEYVNLLDSLHKMEASNAKYREDYEHLSAEMRNMPPPAAGTEDLLRDIEEYRMTINALEDQVLLLKDDQLQAQELAQKLRQAQADKAKARQEMATLQEMVNSSTYYSGRIEELEKELDLIRQDTQNLRRVHRDEITAKEGTIFGQMARIAQLEEELAGATRGPAPANPDLEKEVRNLKGRIMNRDNHIQILEGKLRDLGVTDSVGPLAPTPTVPLSARSINTVTSQASLQSPAALHMQRQPSPALTPQQRSEQRMKKPSPALLQSPARQPDLQQQQPTPTLPKPPPQQRPTQPQPLPMPQTQPQQPKQQPPQQQQKKAPAPVPQYPTPQNQAQQASPFMTRETRDTFMQRGSLSPPARGSVSPPRGRSGPSASPPRSPPPRI